MDKKFIVNFYSPKSKDSYLAKTLTRLGIELGDRYFMSENQALNYFVRGSEAEGQQMYVEFLRNEYGINVTPFRFEGHELYAYGYEVESSEGLTGALLRYGYPRIE